MTHKQKETEDVRDNAVVCAAKQAATRRREEECNTEPSLGSRLGQIGILGWAIILPILLGIVIGQSLDRMFSTGIMFSAAFILLGAVAGMWSAWRWMHRS